MFVVLHICKIVSSCAVTERHGAMAKAENDNFTQHPGENFNEYIVFMWLSAFGFRLSSCLLRVCVARKWHEKDVLWRAPMYAQSGHAKTNFNL